MLELATIKDVKTNIGRWCKTLRKEQNLSRAEMAEQLSLSPLTIAKLENGQNPTLDTLLKVLQYFQELENLNVWIQNKAEDLNLKTSLY